MNGVPVVDQTPTTTAKTKDTKKAGATGKQKPGVAPSSSGDTPPVTPTPGDSIKQRYRDIRVQGYKGIGI